MNWTMAERQQAMARYFQQTVFYWREIYDRQTVFAEIYRRRHQTAVQMLDELRLPRNIRALDAGCGPGLMTLELTRRGYAVAAVDAVAEMLRRTRRAALQAGASERVLASMSDVGNLDFKHEVFHLATVIGVTEWLPSLQRPLRELARVLKPGGYLIISADNTWALNQLLDPLLLPVLKPCKHLAGRVLRGLGARRPELRVRAYSIREFDAALSHAGFSKVRGCTLGFGPFTLFGRPILSEAAGLRLDARLQTMAEKSGRLHIGTALAGLGSVYVTLARKTA